VVWNYYLQLVEVEQAFRNLKGDLAIRPIFHQSQARIEAHIFVSFLAYGLHVTLGRWLRTLAPGLTPRSVLEKFAALQMVDVQIPTSDGRTLILQRYTHPQPELRLLLERLKLELPAQPPPRITLASGQMEASM
jgi:transposase